MSKKYKSIPVHVVEYHNEALEHIYRAIGSKHLPLEGITMIHFDAHPDMIIPDIGATDVFNKEKLFNSLSIENWICPALFAGHINKVYWLKASWAQQIKDGEYKFKIGREKESSKIRVTFPDDYFLSECLYVPESELTESKNIEFYVGTIGEDETRTEKFEFREVSAQTHYILDIDLDFFSTKNPIKEMLPDKEYRHLKSIYEYSPPKSRSESDLKTCTESRKNVLNNLKNMLLDIEKRNLEIWGQDKTFFELKSIYENITKTELGGEIDANLLHEFGCTCDDPELPHHVSSEAEIDGLIVSMETVLKNLNHSPTMITISRSSVDEYCPPDQVDMIQQKVENSLRNLFENMECFYHYKE